ncbi:MAG TPA: hypothetical protein VFM23_09005 [Gemmatimonadales bacterium]|nr:hypothetical protein [Gemmatimonadales bacterium]
MNKGESMKRALPLLLLVAACDREPQPITGLLTTDRATRFTEWSEPVSLGPAINSEFNDQQAALSKDGLTLYFASNRPGTPGAGPNNDIWVARRECLECAFGEPANLGAPVNTPGNDAAPALSRDEHWLFILTDRPGGLGSADIWAAYRENVNDDFGWQPPVNLGAGVNGSGFDGGAAYFENEGGGAQLFFNKSPLPTAGGGDIYVSTKNADGSWGTAVAVDELNTLLTDQRPSISHNGLDIYFFSNRDGGEGGVDIWGATREDVSASFETPTNLGGGINTAAAEQHPFIYRKGGVEQLYFSRNLGSATVLNLDLFVSTRVRQR